MDACEVENGGGESGRMEEAKSEQRIFIEMGNLNRPQQSNCCKDVRDTARGATFKKIESDGFKTVENRASGPKFH